MPIQVLREGDRYSAKVAPPMRTLSGLPRIRCPLRSFTTPQQKWDATPWALWTLSLIATLIGNDAPRVSRRRSDDDIVTDGDG